MVPSILDGPIGVGGGWLLCLMVSQEKRRGRSCFEGIFGWQKKKFLGFVSFWFGVAEDFFGGKSS